MKQKTAIIRAFQRRYDLVRVTIRDGFIYGQYSNGLRTGKLAYLPDVWTADHNGHSTRVYSRHVHVCTVFGTVEV